MCVILCLVLRTGFLGGVTRSWFILGVTRSRRSCLPWPSNSPSGGWGTFRPSVHPLAGVCVHSPLPAGTDALRHRRVEQGVAQSCWLVDTGLELTLVPVT